MSPSVFSSGISAGGEAGCSGHFEQLAKEFMFPPVIRKRARYFHAVITNRARVAAKEMLNMEPGHAWCVGDLTKNGCSVFSSISRENAEPSKFAPNF